MNGHHLPNCVTALWVVTEGLVLPQEAQEIRSAIDDAMKSRNPKGPLNRAVARLKRRNGGILAFCNWLASIRNEFEKSNLIHFYSAWERGFSQIQAAQGTTFHQAFGMDSAGRRSPHNFSDHDNIAVYLEHHARKARFTPSSLDPDDLPIYFDHDEPSIYLKYYINNNWKYVNSDNIKMRSRRSSSNHADLPLCFDHEEISTYIADFERIDRNYFKIYKKCKKMMGNRFPDDRTIRWSRKKYSSLSDVDISAMAEHSRAILNLP